MSSWEGRGKKEITNEILDQEEENDWYLSNYGSD